MQALHLLRQFLAVVLLGAGLLCPGYSLLRVWMRRPGLVASFLGSAALLMNLVLLLDAARVELTLLSLGGASLALTVLAWLFRKRADEPMPEPGPFSWRLTLPWLPAIGLGIGAILYRSWVSPLSGYDHVFRWDFLAVKMAELHGIGFYPAARAEDYWIYGWCDGIAPLVSTLNYWCYACLGGTHQVFTFWRLLLETGLLFLVAGRLATRLGGASAFGPTLALLACCPLFLWSVAIGQETGLTALSLAAMLYFLMEEPAGDNGVSPVLQAGLAAGVGGLAREYGLAWTLLGLCLLLARRRPRREWLIFLSAAVLVAAPWYLRNWARTGNPLWSHSLAGLFATNPAHVALMKDIGAMYEVTGHLDALANTVWLLVPVCGLTCACMVGGVGKLGRRAWPLVLGVILVTLLWLWSLHQTAAGWNFAKRVLAPALLLCSVLGGVFLAQARGWWARLLALGGLLFAADAAFRSLFLPQQPWISPAHYGSDEWDAEYRDRAFQAQDAVWDRIAQACHSEDRGLLTDHSFVHAYFARRGVKVRPLVSPELDFVWSRDSELSVTLTRLRSLGIRFVILGLRDGISVRQETRSRFLRELASRQKPNAEFWFVRIYDLDKLQPAPATTH